MGSKGDCSRARILSSAESLFYHRGYGRTSYADLARASGIPKGNYYYYYKVKDDLLCEVLERRLSQIRQQLAGWEKAARSPKERLKRFVRMVREDAEALSLYGCPIGSMNTELGKDRPGLQSRARQLFEAYAEWLTAQFVHASRKRQAREHALHLMAMAQGASLLSHVYGDPAIAREETRHMDRWLDAVLRDQGEHLS